jgi:hypothetical protein
MLVRTSSRVEDSRSTMMSLDDPPASAYTVARRLCATCPVREPCAEAGASERHGMWGGLSPKERKRRRRIRAA